MGFRLRIILACLLLFLVSCSSSKIVREMVKECEESDDFGPFKFNIWDKGHTTSPAAWYAELGTSAVANGKKPQDLEIECYYDDPDSTHPENRGFLCPHVYVLPEGTTTKTYKPYACIWENGKLIGKVSSSVTVNSFDADGKGETYLVSKNSKFSEGPTSTKTFTDIKPAFEALRKLWDDNIGSSIKVQLLFHCEDTYTTDQNLRTGHYFQGEPIIIGKFGNDCTDRKPTIQYTGGDEALFNFVGVDGKNITIMDLKIKGNWKWGTDDTLSNHDGIVFGQGTNLLAFNNEVSNFSNGLATIGPWGCPGGAEEVDTSSGTFFVDNNVHHNASNHMGTNPRLWVAFIGNILHRTWISHNVYTYWQKYMALIENIATFAGFNTRSQPKPEDFDYPEDGLPTTGNYYSNRLNLRIATYCYPEYATFVDNVAEEGGINLQVGLVDSSAKGVHSSYILFEGNKTGNRYNYFGPWFGSQFNINIAAAQNVTARNNILHNGQDHSYGIGLSIQIEDPECDTSSHVKIYNNTHYDSNSVIVKPSWDSYQGTFVQMNRSDHEDIQIFNNISVALASQKAYVYRGVSDLDPAQIKSDNNVYSRPNFEGALFTLTSKEVSDWTTTYAQDTNSLLVDPLWVDPDEGDFSLESTSPAIDLGATEFQLIRDTDWGLRETLDSGAYKQ
jgi:hypothetical protein